MSLIFSTNQLLKTQKEVIKINSYIYRYKDIDRFYEQKSNTPKLLAITDKPHNKQELLDLTENLEKDLIDFGDEEVKDLILLFRTKKQQQKNYLWTKSYFQKVKSAIFYKNTV